MTETTRLGLPLLAAAQAQKHVTVNEALARLDGLVQAVAQGGATGTPPGDASDGQLWIVGAPAVADWTGWEGDLALASGGGWQRIVAHEGWRVWDLDTGKLLLRTVAGWLPLDAALGLLSVATLADGSVPALGIGAAADATNGLVFRGTNALCHSATGIDLTLNKAAPAEDASLSFKTGFSARALLGLMGNEAFALKVSADGAAFREALVVDGATGRVSAPEGLDVAGSLGGSAVQSGPQDAGVGRLLRVGAFGANGATTLDPAADLDAATTVATRVGAGPATVGNPFVAAVVEVVRDDPATVQLAVERPVAGPPRLALRVTEGSGWSGWSVGYGTANVLGQVGLSGGVPTGAVIERGAGTGGEWVRLADGTQLCWTDGHDAGPCATAIGAGFRGAETSWTFPAPFAGGAPVVTGAAGAAGTVWLAIGAPTGTEVALRPMAFAAVASSLAARLVAVGRWA